MITKINAYKSSDGTAHSTLEEAQKHALKLLLKETKVQIVDNVLVDSIMDNRDKIVDILTTKPNSLTKARKINGGTKKRTPKHIAEQHPLPLGETGATA